MAKFENHFLRELSDAQISLLRPEPWPLRRHQYVYRMDDEVMHIYFMERGYVSLIRPMADGAQVPVWSYDGTLIGSQIRFWLPETLYDIYVRVGGDGYRVSRSRLLTAMVKDPDLQRLMLAWVHYFDHASVKSLACQLVHSVEQRFCRMLLGAHIAMRDDTRIPLSLPEFAEMLGTTSSHLYRVAKPLEAQGAIRAQGYHIDVFDTTILKARVCSCFEALNQRRARAFAHIA